MSDSFVRIYLYVLIGANILTVLLWLVFWVAQSRRPRHSLVKPRYHWRTLFSLITGLIGWFLFSTRTLSNTLIVLVTIVMLAGFHFAELLGVLKRGVNKHAT